jgi:hypothetical protein
VAALREGHGKAKLDLNGVNGLTPSFFDELLLIIDESRRDSPESELSVTIQSPPTDVSPILVAVARVHGLSITQPDGGAWVISVAQRPHGSNG